MEPIKFPKNFSYRHDRYIPPKDFLDLLEISENIIVSIEVFDGLNRCVLRQIAKYMNYTIRTKETDDTIEENICVLKCFEEDGKTQCLVIEIPLHVDIQVYRGGALLEAIVHPKDSLNVSVHILFETWDDIIKHTKE